MLRIEKRKKKTETEAIKIIGGRRIVKRKKTIRELINQNKVEILKDKSSIEKIEKKIDNKYLLRS